MIFISHNNNNSNNSIPQWRFLDFVPSRVETPFHWFLTEKKMSVFYQITKSINAIRFLYARGNVNELVRELFASLILAAGVTWSILPFKLYME